MKRGVVVISKESWSDTRWARKQWLAYFLAEHHDIDCVQYFNRHRSWWRGEAKDVSGSKGKVTVQQEDLWFPGERWALCRDLNRQHIARTILGGLDDKHEWLALFYHPWDAAMIPRLSRRSLVMFDWTEDWTSFHDMRIFHEAQRQAVCQSDCVLTVSESLYNLAVEWRRSDQHVLLSPNAT